MPSDCTRVQCDMEMPKEAGHVDQEDQDFIVIAADEDDDARSDTAADAAAGVPSANTWRGLLHVLVQEQAREFAQTAEEARRRLSLHRELAIQTQQNAQVVKQLHASERARLLDQLLVAKQQLTQQQQQQQVLLQSSPSVFPSACESGSLSRDAGSPASAVRNLRIQLDSLCRRVRQLEGQLARRERDLAAVVGERDRLRRRLLERHGDDSWDELEATEEGRNAGER